ncbi:MAG: HD domain-containing protein [Endomicrobia bacterium]|nr:HD domain-containing protein [Endomicrobiia bacterium]MDW8055303.1 HD domain-containing protein [Elusimicrobiota bacterium]
MKFLNKQLLDLLRDLNNTFEEVYVVGGIIRDRIIKRQMDNGLDVDIIIKNLSVKELKSLLKKHSLPFVVLDKINRIYRTVLTFNDGFIITLDISSYKDLKQDIFRRDFTINTLCLKMADFIRYITTGNEKFMLKRLIDLTSSGLKDIKNNVLKETRENSVIDDPIRILRVARFMCYGFKPEEELVKTCVRNKHLLNYVAKERINEELKKIFNFSYSYKILEWLDTTGILETVIPEIEIIKKKGKNTQFRKFYYHKEGLWQHTKLTYKSVEDVVNKLKKFFPQYYSEINPKLQNKQYVLKYIALLHDIGKPFVVKKEKGRIRFFRHEMISAEIAEKVLKELRLSNDEIRSIVLVIKNHMRLGSLYNSRNTLTERAYLRLFNELQTDLFSLLIFSIADRLSYESIPFSIRKSYLSNYGSINKFVKFENKILEKYFEYLKKSSLPRLITGYDVMNTFGIPEGPLVGKILNFIREAQILGKISNREEALKLANKYVKLLQ